MIAVELRCSRCDASVNLKDIHSNGTESVLEHTRDGDTDCYAPGDNVSMYLDKVRLPKGWTQFYRFNHCNKCEEIRQAEAAAKYKRESELKRLQEEVAVRERLAEVPIVDELESILALAGNWYDQHGIHKRLRLLIDALKERESQVAA